RRPPIKPPPPAKEAAIKPTAPPVERDAAAPAAAARTGTRARRDAPRGSVHQGRRQGRAGGSTSTRHACKLRHAPTGLAVRCQRFRALADNRREARKLLALALDDLYNGPDSRRCAANAEEAARKKKAARKAKKRLAAKKAGKDKDDK
ncbi:hypothetical protein BDR26DRAFT_866287, partial [Obelidium mucronatum]